MLAYQQKMSKQNKEVFFLDYQSYDKHIENLISNGRLTKNRTYNTIPPVDCEELLDKILQCLVR